MATTKLAVSFKDRNLGTYDRQIDKITHSELNTLLNEKIDTAFAHVPDEVRHITAEERNRWNNMLSKLKPASKTENGLFSAADKAKLDSISEGANRYSHPLSGVKSGSYTRVTVSDQGHVMYGDNPTRMDITVSNSERLGDQLPSAFAKTHNPTFTGTVKIPDVTINSSPNSPVTVKLLETYVREQAMQLNKIYPIGSVYMTFSNADPATTIGGTWRKLPSGKMLLSSGDEYTVRATGGEKSVTLTQANIPAHTHRSTKRFDIDTSNMIADHYHATGTIVNNNGIFITSDNNRTMLQLGKRPPNYYFTGWNGSGHGNDRFAGNDTQKWNLFTTRAIPITNSQINAGSAHVDIDIVSSSVGSGTPHNNMPPYLVVHMWERIG